MPVQPRTSKHPATSSVKLEAVDQDNFSVTCMPDGILPWVHINKTFGVLTVDPNISREAHASGADMQDSKPRNGPTKLVSHV